MDVYEMMIVEWDREEGVKKIVQPLAVVLGKSKEKVKTAAIVDYAREHPDADIDSLEVFVRPFCPERY